MKVARRRGATHAHPQGRVLYSAEAVCALQTAAAGGAERHVHVMCEGLRLRVDAAALERILMQSGLDSCAESAIAAPRAADAAAARRY